MPGAKLPGRRERIMLIPATGMPARMPARSLLMPSLDHRMWS